MRLMRTFENLADWEKKAVFMCGVKPTLHTKY